MGFTFRDCNTNAFGDEATCTYGIWNRRSRTLRGRCADITDPARLNHMDDPIMTGKQVFHAQNAK